MTATTSHLLPNGQDLDAARAEAALVGQPWTQASVNAAKAALTEDFKPLSDMRASAAVSSRMPWRSIAASTRASGRSISSSSFC